MKTANFSLAGSCGLRGRGRRCWGPSSTSTSMTTVIIRDRHRLSRNISSSPTPSAGQRRTYANAVDDPDGPWQWPTSSPSGAIPTPYQIFHLPKGAPYSKRTFYELVKRYHPDRLAHSPDGSEVGRLPDAVRLERYRLVVAAHEILCDPIKRRAYDRYGAGWTGATAVHPQATSSKGRAPSTEPSPKHNATWEDWERWYEHGASGGKQEPVLMENNTFLSVLVIFAVLAGMVETVRARSLSIAFLEQQDRLHHATNRDMNRSRTERQLTTGAKGDRIQAFLRLRDPVTADPLEDRHRKLLPEPEVCSSHDIKDRSSRDVYHHDRENINDRSR